MSPRWEGASHSQPRCFAVCSSRHSGEEGREVVLIWFLVSPARPSFSAEITCQLSEVPPDGKRGEGGVLVNYRGCWAE